VQCPHQPPASSRVSECVKIPRRQRTEKVRQGDGHRIAGIHGSVPPVARVTHAAVEREGDAGELPLHALEIRARLYGSRAANLRSKSSEGSETRFNSRALWRPYRTEQAKRHANRRRLGRAPHAPEARKDLRNYFEFHHRMKLPSR
jgi:hypothetical protein